MFMSLTNASGEFYGKPISIRKEFVLTVFESGDFGQKKTNIFVPPHGTWEVQESVEEVVKLLNEKDGD